jgi:hypothetical protein
MVRHVRLIIGMSHVQGRFTAARRRDGAAVAPISGAASRRRSKLGSASGGLAASWRQFIGREVWGYVGCGRGEIWAEFPRWLLKTAWLTCVWQVAAVCDHAVAPGRPIFRPPRLDIGRIEGVLCGMICARGRDARDAAGGARAAVDACTRGRSGRRFWPIRRGSDFFSDTI